jgi:hypothetical protein
LTIGPNRFYDNLFLLILPLVSKWQQQKDILFYAVYKNATGNSIFICPEIYYCFRLSESFRNFIINLLVCLLYGNLCTRKQRKYQERGKLLYEKLEENHCKVTKKSKKDLQVEKRKKERKEKNEKEY